MSFEKYKNDIIEDFIQNLKDCDIIDKDETLTKEQIELIHKEFEKHEDCFNNHKRDFDLDNCDLIGSYDYAHVAVSIECNHCQEVIINDEVVVPWR